MPFEVAPAPIPSWERSEKSGSVGSEGAQPLEAISSAVPKSHGLDAAFLCRLHRTIAWFGALATFLVAVMTAQLGQKPTLAFVSGLLIGWGLLATQSFIVGRTLSRGRSTKERSRKMLWWLLVPVKYLAVAALLGWLLDVAKLPATWLAFGFVIVQMMLFAKVMGHILSGSVRTVRQVYIRPGSD
jgi:hypothetical protein